MPDPIIVPEPVPEADPSHPRWTPPPGNRVELDPVEDVPAEEDGGDGAR